MVERVVRLQVPFYEDPLRVHIDEWMRKEMFLFALQGSVEKCLCFFFDQSFTFLLASPWFIAI